MKVPTVGGSAGTPGALMFIAGLALGYWALSGWGLFGLGDKSKRLVSLPGGKPTTGTGTDHNHDHNHNHDHPTTGGAPWTKR